MDHTRNSRPSAIKKTKRLIKSDDKECNKYRNQEELWWSQREMFSEQCKES